MDSLQKIENYLIARGCDIHKVKDHLVEFRLPGETSRSPGGRLSLARDGSLKMWHRYAEKGLAAPTFFCRRTSISLPKNLSSSGESD